MYTFYVICSGVRLYIFKRVLPGTSLEDIGLFQRNEVSTQGHGVGIEVRADGYSGIVASIGQRKEYLGRDADTLDAEVAVYVASLVGSHLDVRNGSVHGYTADAVRTGIDGIEGHLHGAASLVYQYKVGVGVYKCSLSAAEHYLVGFHYKLMCLQGGYGVVIGYDVLYLLFCFQPGTLCVSLGFAVCALFGSTLLCIHGGCGHAYQY